MSTARLLLSAWTRLTLRLALLLLSPSIAFGAIISLKPVAFSGVDVLADNKLVAPLRLSADHALLADEIEGVSGGIILRALRCRDTNAVAFAPDDYVSITTDNTAPPGEGQLLVRFKLTIRSFQPARWQRLFRHGSAPFHFLVCAMPEAAVWHQRGWLNATPRADPFPLLLDPHVGSPEISSKWNRDWSYLCPLGAHPIPMIGLWNPEGRLYVGYDFSEARATDQSERYITTAYCWGRGTNYIALTYPYGGQRYGELLFPQTNDVLESRFHLIIDTGLGPTDDPNERFQARLFARYPAALPAVPARNDLSWIPGSARRSDFASPIGLDLWGPGGETTFYPTNTLLIHGWTGHREMPIVAAVKRGDTAGLNLARTRVEGLINTYGKWITISGDRCFFFEKPLAGAWRAEWGGPPATTLHNSDGWYPARVLVELYRYDRSRGQAKPEYLTAIDGLFNWAKHFVWSRNEFADVPSSPFAIGGTLSAAFLLDYFFTFRSDSTRAASTELALTLARNLTWRYLQIWGMDSDRFDDAIDGSFLAEPNSGRDWAGLACANEVNWNVDALTQVYVHTGDARMRYYLRGLLQRWPALYRPIYETSLANYGSDAVTEGYGLFDGAGPGRGGRYSYGFSEAFPLNEPVGNSLLRVVAGHRACIAFCKDGTHSDAVDYRSRGNGAFAFRIVSSLTEPFDVSLSYPFVDISDLPVQLTRNGQTTLLTTEVRRPQHAPSSLYVRGLMHGDQIQVGTISASAEIIPLEAPHTYSGPPRSPVSRGAFQLMPLASDTNLTENWSDLTSFAGIIPGERWAFGVPYHQGTNAAASLREVDIAGAQALFVAYAPPPDALLERAPAITLDDGTEVRLSGNAIPSWRGWPPIFLRAVLLDYAPLPPGRARARVDPKGTLLMAFTTFQGDIKNWSRITNAFALNGQKFDEEIRARDRLLALRTEFASLPPGKIAVLPLAAAGPAANFLKQTGLEAKVVRLTDTQLIDTNQFNPARFPLTLYLSSEHYLKTVNSTGDGKTAVTRYLAAGGTIALLATEPFPFFYGDGPARQPGPSDPILPPLGLPITVTFEQPPRPVIMRVDPALTVLTNTPASFPFPPGDSRLRAIDRTQINSAHRYTPWIRAQDIDGRVYGDAAGYIEFGTGAARNGRVLYLWSTLLSGPQGNLIMADAIPWLLQLTRIR